MKNAESKPRKNGDEIHRRIIVFMTDLTQDCAFYPEVRRASHEIYQSLIAHRPDVLQKKFEERVEELKSGLLKPIRYMGRYTWSDKGDFAAKYYIARAEEIFDIIFEQMILIQPE